MSAVRAVTMGPAPATPPGSPRMSTHPRPPPSTSTTSPRNSCSAVRSRG
ncbi:hypothetical protein SFR_1112 [Streptomyces sp. FR-008]|nr:hypothetical protein SFR_1112 [Streptomyces sp. FR-008]